MADARKVLSPVGKRVRSLIIISVVVLVLIGAQPFIWSQVLARAGTLHGKRAQTQQVADLQLRNSEIEEAYASQQSFLDQLTSVIPRVRDTLQVIERMETVAQETGVALTIVRLAEGDPLAVRGRAVVGADGLLGANQEKVIPLFISARAVAPSSRLLQFLDKVEHSPELSRLTQLSMDRVVSQSNNPVPDGTWSMSLTVIFYLQDRGNG